MLYLIFSTLLYIAFYCLFTSFSKMRCVMNDRVRFSLIFVILTDFIDYCGALLRICFIVLFIISCTNWIPSAHLIVPNTTVYSGTSVCN